jgi:hypothetical protein
MNRRKTSRPVIRTAGLLAALAIGPLGLSACSGDAEADSAKTGTTNSAAEGAPDAALDEAQDDSGVPAECKEAFPTAFGRADLAEVTLMPASWPRDAVDGTLCQTAEAGNGMQVASYATTASPAEVLDAVQDALPGSYEVARQDQGMGDQLDGSGDGVSFRVTTRPGAFDVTFAQE